ncbi:hypothetical protein [Methanosarcina spherical virus]|nr:hypothetical protein FJIADALF_00010 [Methanosarcina spherical virus]
MVPLIIFTREEKTALIFNEKTVKTYHFDQTIRFRVRYKVKT